VRGKGLAQQRAVRFQQLGPGHVAVALGQARRAFDIAEEQRQNAFGQGGHEDHATPADRSSLALPAAAWRVFIDEYIEIPVRHTGISS
jgi:hypothetical protein